MGYQTLTCSISGHEAIPCGGQKNHPQISTRYSSVPVAVVDSEAKGEMGGQSAQLDSPQLSSAQLPRGSQNEGAVILVWVTHFGPLISRAARK